MQPDQSRRLFLQFLAASPLFAALPAAARPELARPESLDQALNINHLKLLAQQNLDLDAYHFIVGGSDDMATTEENEAAFSRIKIRPRRLVDVAEIDTSVRLFGREYGSPILLAPAGDQQRIHPDGELVTASAAAANGHLMIASMMSNYAIEEITAVAPDTWFQLYPAANREFMTFLVERAERAGCETLVLTVDGPTRGNHEAERWFRRQNKENRDKTAARRRVRLGNWEGYDGRKGIGDPSFSWDDVKWLRSTTSMNLVLKGIVTREDAKLCRRAGVDGVIVSNHGGRQEGNGRATADVLPEVADVLGSRMPVLMDGGIRRGADAYKAIASGADAVCVGRPYLWGLGAAGEPGASLALKILQTEFVRTMQFAGTTDLGAIRSKSIYRGSSFTG